MKRILLLSTGGTIASVAGENGLVPGLSAEQVLDHVPEIKSWCDVECRTVFSLDSSNVQPEEWRTIAIAAYEGLESHDGVVILHGTDTMAYTSAMLSFMLQNLDKPVIITGSQHPIQEKNTDAKENLYFAFKAVLEDLHGVFVFFHKKLILGARAVKVRTTSLNAFESINAKQAGAVKDDKLILTLPNQMHNSGERCLNDAYDPDVFLLKLIPGTHPEFFDYFLQMGYKGLVIEAFGLGGLHYIRRNLKEKLKLLVSKEIPVVITSQCLYEIADLTIYEVGRMTASEGIIPGYDMTSEAAVTKLMWILGNTRDIKDIRKLFLTDFAGEICIPPDEKKKG